MLVEQIYSLKLNGYIGTFLSALIPEYFRIRTYFMGNLENKKGLCGSNTMHWNNVLKLN